MSSPSAPPPNYGAAVGQLASYPQPGMVAEQPAHEGPPPKYEPPKVDPTANQYPGYQTQPGYIPAAPTTTVILHQPRYGPDPTTISCPNCSACVTTHTQHTAGALTWLTAGLICLFGCWMGCCLVPFCINDLQDVEHRCPNCGRTLGVYARL